MYTHPDSRPVGQQVVCLHKPARGVVHIVREVQLGHGVPAIQVCLQHVLYLGQVQLRVVLLEVLGGRETKLEGITESTSIVFIVDLCRDDIVRIFREAQLPNLPNHRFANNP